MPEVVKLSKIHESLKIRDARSLRLGFGIFLCTLRIIKIIKPDRSNRVLACLEHRWHVGFQPCIVRAVNSSSDNGEVTSFQPLSDNWFLALIILDERSGVPISCICNHIDAARRVAVGATRHAFLALHTSCRVAAPARFVVFESISSPLVR